MHSFIPCNASPLTPRDENDTVDPHPLPSQSSPSELLSSAVAQIAAIAANPAFDGNTCAQCLAALEVAKFLVMAAPEQGPLLAEAVCVYFNYSSTCYDEYSALELGSVFSQVVALANVGGYDGQVSCPVAAAGKGIASDSWNTCLGTQEPVLQCCQFMSDSADGAARFDQLVRETEAGPAAGTKTAQR